jgi:hypothetical protein
MLCLSERTNLNTTKEALMLFRGTEYFVCAEEDRMERKENEDRERQQDLTDSRRRFLEETGRFALATSTAITLLLSSGVTRPAWASGHGNHGFGDGDGDGVRGWRGEHHRDH